MGGFRKFLLRGNLVDLAVAVVIGVAFSAIITALVADLITPLIAAIGGNANFADLHFTINKSTFKYGDFINAALTFSTIAAVVFFLVIKPFNLLRERFRSEPPPDPTIKACPHCLSTIPAEARVCAHCTRDTGPAPAAA